ncbi:MAG: hypothetical protein J5836_01895 [Clostridia bacterium]|nr:hypothetical protein [Clostridia bacterium]
MKFIKTKICFAVMAATFVSAGILGIKPVSVARADGVDVSSGFYMENGAAVKAAVSEGKDFRGIGWVTHVDKSFYLANEFDGTERFGAIIAPTASIVGELSHSTPGVKDIENLTAIDASSADKTYRTVMDFSVVPADKRQAAYRMELTCRAYVKVGGTYYYAPMTGITTSRSARQVAVAADNAGDLDVMSEEMQGYVRGFYKEQCSKGFSVKFGEYEGAGILETTKGNFSPIIVDLEHLPTVENPIVWKMLAANPAQADEITIDAQKITGTFSGGGTKTFTITDVTNYLTAGEHYLNVFDHTNQYVYRYPIIVATKVLTEMADFEEFSYLRTNVRPSDGKTTPAIQEGIDEAQCKHDGYYVLANDITATDYERPVIGGQSTWIGYANWAASSLGLTGTFNGLGHIITDLQFQNNVRTGLFEVVNGGTIKNLGFYQPWVKNDASARYAGCLAYMMINPKIENVFVRINSTNSKPFAKIYNYAFASYLATTVSGGSSLNNVYIFANYKDVSATATVDGGVFDELVGAQTSTIVCNNVYLLSDMGFAFRSKKAIVDETTINVCSYYVYGDNQIDEGDAPILYNPPSLDPAAIFADNAEKIHLSGLKFAAGAADMRAVLTDTSPFKTRFGWTIASSLPTMAGYSFESAEE